MTTERFKSIFAYIGVTFVVILMLIGPTAAAMYDRANDKTAQVAKDQSPLRGDSPVFTTVQMKPCADHLAPFCSEWSWCNSSPPALSEPQKLWNVHVVGDKDGAALVCEWRRGDR
jgi:hypothetical protein